jgi:glutamate N-acetyltransferase / amino-acid N-acetyltransferase
MDINWIEKGGVTSPSGWLAGASYAGIKTYGDEPRYDLGLLYSESACSVAGIFTRNAVCGAPVTLDRERVRSGVAQALIVNSGCSNVAMGERGLRDASRMTQLAGQKLNLPEQRVLVASTGVIGRPLPMKKIEAALPEITPSREGGLLFSRAIITTDTVIKSHALQVSTGDKVYIVGGTAKGAGMVHPDMATVFCFLTTDAPVSPVWLNRVLREVGDVSFNMIDVDMDTSTSDTMLAFANGSRGGTPIDDRHPASDALRKAFELISIELARDLARDGEGARTLIEVTVQNAVNLEQARKAARTIVSSPLVKTMVTGRDPNLGRVLAALGRSGAVIDIARTTVWIGQHCAFKQGIPTSLSLDTISRAMDAPEVKLRLDLGVGSAEATAWGCDLTEGYIHINAHYST